MRSGDDRQVCHRLPQRLTLVRRAIIGMYFPPISWPMTGIGKRIGMVEEVFAQRLITREGDLSAVEEKKHDFMCLCVCTIVQCWEGQT